MLRLADVLAEESFALELLSGGPDAPPRDARGAHAVEVDVPGRWLDPGWIMLTTGVRLRGNAAAQRGLVHQLEEAGASALGFGVGLGLKRVPAALVEVAQERAFLVFEVPYETPFKEVRAALPGDVFIGLGRPMQAMADAHHSLRDAELAVGRGGRIIGFEDFDLGTFMVSEIAPERLAPKLDEILSFLHANPPLHDPLEAYFAHDMDIAATAAALHVHRNSPRYRLARAEQVLGRSLRRPATIAAVYLAPVADHDGPPTLGGAPLPGRRPRP